MLRLSRLLAPSTRIELPEGIAGDLQQCLQGLRADVTLDPVALGIRARLPEVIDRLAGAFCIDILADGG